jgi:hypothetical protein
MMNMDWFEDAKERGIEIHDGMTYDYVFNAYVSLLLKENKKMNEKLTAIENYSKSHVDEMWAATVMSVILECDFRDVPTVLRDKFAKISEVKND